MRTVSFDIEQHILLAALESSSRKVRHYLLAETRAATVEATSWW